jgi:hypothetical protein
VELGAFSGLSIREIKRLRTINFVGLSVDLASSSPVYSYPADSGFPPDIIFIEADFGSAGAAGSFMAFAATETCELLVGCLNFYPRRARAKAITGAIVDRAEKQSARFGFPWRGLTQYFADSLRDARPKEPTLTSQL